MLRISDRILSKSNKIMLTAEAIRTECHVTIVDAIQRRRQEGAARAIAAVARIFGFSERRVVSYQRNEVRNPPGWELMVIREKREEELRLWLAQTEARAAAARARLAELRERGSRGS